MNRYSQTKALDVPCPTCHAPAGERCAGVYVVLCQTRINAAVKITRTMNLSSKRQGGRL